MAAVKLQTCLPYVQVEMTLRMLDSGPLPRFKGATLRGAFGHHLKRLACHVEHGDCRRCLLRGRCVFPVFFEGAAPDGRTIMRRYPFVPQPFVPVVDAGDDTEFRIGDRLRFGMRLFGPAGELLPYVAYTFMQVGRCGLGRQRLRFVVERIDDGPRQLFQQHDQHIKPASRRDVPWPGGGHPDEAGEVDLVFVSPVRLRRQGRLARELEFSHLLRSIVRRLSILSHFYGRWIGPPGRHGAVLDLANEVRIADHQLEWVEFQRFSTRQQHRMTLGGLIGRITARGPLGPLLPWLRAAEITHVGKAASFGFGRIRTEVPRP